MFGIRKVIIDIREGEGRREGRQEEGRQGANGMFPSLLTHMSLSSFP